jgi:[ribosomal protein S5]-alanine N-acetyltransferase
MSIEIHTFPNLETDRLVLRKITKDDASNMFSYLSDSEVMKYYGLEPFKTINEALDEISWYQSLEKNHTGLRWGITLKENGIIIGSCGFHNFVSQHFRTEIGFELSRDYWGKGIAGEALKAIIAYGFQHFGFQRIEALIEPPNLLSQRLVEKQGFMKEGLLRKYEYTRGKFDDLYMYSLLKEDFSKSEL